MTSLTKTEELLAQFKLFVSKPLEWYVYEIKRTDLIYYLTGTVAEVSTPKGSIEFVHEDAVYVGDFIVLNQNGTATHFKRSVFQAIQFVCYQYVQPETEEKPCLTAVENTDQPLTTPEQNTNSAALMLSDVPVADSVTPPVCPDNITSIEKVRREAASKALNREAFLLASSPVEHQKVKAVMLQISSILRKQANLIVKGELPI